MSEDQAQSENLPAIPAEPPAVAPAGLPSLRETYWMATAISKAITLPEAMQGKPQTVLAVMLAGRELGIGPMAATRMVHVINGQTSLATELKLALAKQAGHEVVAVDEGPGWCVAGCRQHPDAGPVGWKLEHETAVPDVPIVGAWTVAADITYTTKGQTRPLVEKDNWRNYPRDMLWWRAAGAFMRRHCPGVAGGLVTVEELGEGGGDGD